MSALHAPVRLVTETSTTRIAFPDDEYMELSYTNGDAEERAAYVVRAVNSYSALVDTLKAALEWNSVDEEAYDEAAPTQMMLHNRRSLLRVALRKAGVRS